MKENVDAEKLKVFKGGWQIGKSYADLAREYRDKEVYRLNVLYLQEAFAKKLKKIDTSKYINVGIKVAAIKEIWARYQVVINNLYAKRRAL